MAADELLSLLTLYGFKHSETVAPALRTACETESAHEIVRWLAGHLKPEDLPTRTSTTKLNLSESEQIVAKSFACSLGPRTGEGSPTLTGQHLRREATSALLANAVKQADAEADQLTEMEVREREVGAQKAAAVDEQIALQQADLTLLLSDLDSLASRITTVLAEAASDDKLLCFSKLAEYKEVDSRLMASLRELYRVEFGYALDEGTCMEDTESSPDVERLLYGESEGVIKSRAVEIERMRLAYGSSLERKARMQALQAKREKSLQALQGALTRPELSSKDSAMLKGEVDKQRASLERLLERKHQILEVELPAMCQSLAALHCWDVVKAEYDVELTRNKYYCGRKESVLNVLLGRAARMTALLAAAKAEAGVLSGVQDSLQLVHEDLAGLRTATDLRASKCEALEGLPPPKQPLPSPLKVPQAGEIEARQQEFSACVSKITDNIGPALRDRSGVLHAFAFESAAVQAPRLTPKELEDALQSIERVNAELMEANEAVYKQQEGYNSIMRLQRDQIGVERSVFSTFFTNPEALIGLAREATGKQLLQKKTKGSPPKGSPPKMPGRRPRVTR